MNPSPAQISYALHLLKQAGKDQPTEAEVRQMDSIEIGALIGALKNARGQAMYYGNGQFGGWRREAAAAVEPVRQRTQYTCMAASLSMCLKALGMDYDEDTTNKVMGAQPMRGASWEQALAAAQHFGCRATLTAPCTLTQMKAWTDAGVPVMIAWNPEGREWSHASVVFDVTDTEVHVADPNIPNPAETVRVVTHDEFYHLWFEKFPNYLVRRPAMAIEREITPEGRQVKASRTASETVVGKTITIKDKPRDPGRTEYGPEFVTQIMRHPGNGAHQNREKDVARGTSRKPKHRNQDRDREAEVVAERFLAARVADRFLGEQDDS